MRIATLLARVLLGLAFLVFGLNYFLGFLPNPPHPGPSGDFLAALFAGKVLLVAKTVEVAAGIALLSNRFVPFALTLLAPVVVGIVLFHTVLEPSGAPMAVLIAGLTGFLAYVHRAAYAPLFQARAAEPEATQRLERAAATS